VLRAINHEGRTIVLTTHYMDEAEALCDQVSILDHGRLLTTDTPRALVAGLGRAQRILVDSGQIDSEEAAGLPGVEGATEDNGTLALSTHDPGAVLAQLSQRDALRGLQVTSATLDDVFLHLTGREYRA